MEHVYYIYGNQQFEIDRERNRIIDSLLAASQREDSLIHFRAKDFFYNDLSRATDVVADLKNRCEMVTFFADKTVIFISDLQDMPKKKDPAEKIKKILSEIELVQKTDTDDNRWFEAVTLTQHIETHHHLNAGQLVQKIESYGRNTFYLELLHDWQNRIIYQQKGKEEEGIEIKDFLATRLKNKILFNRPEHKEKISSTGNNFLLSILKKYLQQPPEDIYFLLTANVKKNSEINKELFKVINKNAKQIKTTIAYDNFRPLDWVIKEVTAKGLRIDRSGADLLIEVAGADYSILEMELTKLSLLLPKSSQITTDIILNTVSRSKQFNIFRISNFLTEKNLKSSLECLERLLNQKRAEGVAIFGVIVAQFRRLLKILYLKNGRFSDQAIIKRLKLNPWIGQQLIINCRKFSLLELENIILLLAKYDIRLKYNPTEAQIILENICYQICSSQLTKEQHFVKERI